MKMETYQTLQYTVRAVLSGKFIAINIKNDLKSTTLQLKEIEKRQSIASRSVYQSRDKYRIENQWRISVKNVLQKQN